MIGQLRGRCDWQSEDKALIDVGGVGYLIFCSARTLSQLDTQKGDVRVLIETHVREDHIHLYGFIDNLEKQWFVLLSSVQGVGAKMALAILSTFSPDELGSAIVSQDAKLLTRATGVGPKLAGRINVELKDKAAKLASPFASAASTAYSESTLPQARASSLAVLQDALSALENLGYRRSDAERAVRQAQAKLGSDPNLDEVIRFCLAELAQ